MFQLQNKIQLTEVAGELVREYELVYEYSGAGRSRIT